MLKQYLPMLVRRLKVPVDIFHHDHGGIDDDAEIDRAERQEIGVLALKDQENDGKEQGERDVGADDDGAAQIAEKDPLDEKHEQAAKNQVVQHRMRGDADQRAAIVIRDDLHAGRQASVAVEPLDLGLDLGNDVVSVLGPAHHHDGGGDVVVVVPARDAESRHITDRDPGHVLDLNRQAARLGQDDVLDVLDLVTLGDVVGATAVDQADAANVDRLLPDSDLAAADVDVGVTERRDELRDRDVIRLELLEVGVDVELLGGAAPGVDLHHAGNRQETSGHDVILDRAQIGQAEMRRPDQLIAIDLSDEARLLNLRDLITRKIDVLLQADRGLGQREIEVDAIFEGDADKGQTVERRRADVDDARRRVEADLHRNRVIFLHLFGGEAGGLSRDLQDHRRRIGIGLDVQP